MEFRPGIKITQKEAARRFRRSGLSLLGSYHNSQTKVKAECLRCLHTWMTVPVEVFRGCSCPKCRYHNQKVGIAEVKSALRTRGSRIRVLSGPSDYVNERANTIRSHCTVCGHQWKASWHQLKGKIGCPVCARNAIIGQNRLTHAVAEEILAQISPTIRMIGKYFNSKTKIACTCLECGHKWSTVWITLKSGSGCPECAIEKLRLTTDEVKERLQRMCPTIRIIGEYSGVFDSLAVECALCGHKWKTKWTYLCKGRSCPCCGDNFKSESEVREIIERLTKSKFPKAHPSEVPWLHGLHLDGYDSVNKRAFEYDGPQHKEIVPHWHGRKNPSKGLLQQKRRDWRKNVQCWRHGVKLVRIPHQVKDKEEYIKTKLTKLGWVQNASA